MFSLQRLLLLLAMTCTLGAQAADPQIRVLIIDGQNNHDWEGTTDALAATLRSAGRFDVTVETAPQLPFPREPRHILGEKTPEAEADLEKARALYRELRSAAPADFQDSANAWNPDFAAYDAVVVNYNGPDWPESMRDAYLEFVRAGGGTVLIHAANNAFANWEDFNQLIGLGWRPALVGKAAKIDPDSGDIVFPDNADLVSEGKSGHGSKHAFPVTVRAPEHPIMAGLPPVWMHGRDELYHNMRGPAENLTVLSSAYSDPEQRGSGLHEPMTWEVAYGEGRSIVTSLGHLWLGDADKDGLYCAGFQTMFARACEYAATGGVTLAVPENFPGADEAVITSPSLMAWGADDDETISPAFESASAKKNEDPYCMLTPDEEATQFDLADGYVIELIAAEPAVQEPVLTVWDANGVMYVAEMRSYMQDEKGTGTKELKNGRVKRLEDTTGDGFYDRVTTFIDGLNLPRIILPLDGRIAVRETDTMDIYTYEDTDGDGVADQKELLYTGPEGGRNAGGETSVEHQDSGLVWNLDNHIYVTYNQERYRYTTGEWVPEKQPSHWTQWGLDHDDVGNLFWIHNSGPLIHADLHPRYWDTARRLAGKNFAGFPVNLPPPHDAAFMQASSLCLLDDRGGAASEVRGFTSACGQTVFRGHRLPSSDYGDYFFCDPTIHVVRHAEIDLSSGMPWLTKSDDGEIPEFLRSSDINSRFMNAAHGPDGCLYITDMYRGIIQDAGWLSEAPRANIVANGLHDNNQHGRIWRISHKDHAPQLAGPKMLDEPTLALLRHLEHPSGWWRDTAQKTILLRDDREEVVPLLTAMARFSDKALTRLHALWTLDGMEKISPELLAPFAKDRDPRIRVASVQIAERKLIAGTISPEELAIFAEDGDPSVAQQLILTLGLAGGESEIARELMGKAALKHAKHKGVQVATTVGLWGMDEHPAIVALNEGEGFGGDALAKTSWDNIVANWNRGIVFPDGFDNDHKRLIEAGEQHFYQSCVTCHGGDGAGVRVGETDMYLAPGLPGSPRVTGPVSQLIPILLHGLIGPLDGTTYQAGYMAPGAALGLDREKKIAEVLSYIRYAWDQELSVVTEQDVKDAKVLHKDRQTPWTQPELEAIPAGE